MPKTTSDWKLPFPEGADPVQPDVDIKKLAERLDEILDYPGRIISQRTHPLSDTSPAGINNDAGWFTQTSFPDDLPVPSTGHVILLAHVTGSVTLGSNNEDRLIARIKIDFDPDGDGGWTTLTSDDRELSYPNLRRAGIAVQAALRVPVAKARICRYRVVVRQANLGDHGGMLSFQNGRLTITMQTD